MEAGSLSAFWTGRLAKVRPTMEAMMMRGVITRLRAA